MKSEFHLPLSSCTHLLPLVSLLFFEFTFFLWAFLSQGLCTSSWNSRQQDAALACSQWISPQRGEAALRRPLSAHFQITCYIMNLLFPVSVLLDSPVRAEIFVCLAYSILRARNKLYTWESLVVSIESKPKGWIKIRKPHLKQYFLQCGPWTCSFSITWDIVSNANSWASLILLIWKWKAVVWVLSTSGDWHWVNLENLSATEHYWEFSILSLLHYCLSRRQEEKSCDTYIQHLH